MPRQLKNRSRPSPPKSPRRPRNPAKPSAAEAQQQPEMTSPAIKPDTTASDSQTAGSAATGPARGCGEPQAARATDQPAGTAQGDRAGVQTHCKPDGCRERREPKGGVTGNQTAGPTCRRIERAQTSGPPGRRRHRATSSWVRDFGGGDCFYATMTSSTDTAAAIEGFGTAVQPFERMLGDFQAKFHVEPDISVRLIEPSQCEVTNFLRFLGRPRPTSRSLFSTGHRFRTVRRSAARW